jgi:hypothetical protein
MNTFCVLHTPITSSAPHAFASWTANVPTPPKHRNKRLTRHAMPVIGRDCGGMNLDEHLVAVDHGLLDIFALQNVVGWPV